jgi:hypothetical protein
MQHTYTTLFYREKMSYYDRGLKWPLFSKSENLDRGGVHNLSTDRSSFFLPHTGYVTCQLHFEISCRLRERLCTPPIGDFQGKAAILYCGRNITFVLT